MERPHNQPFHLLSLSSTVFLYLDLHCPLPFRYSCYLLAGCPASCLIFGFSSIWSPSSPTFTFDFASCHVSSFALFLDMHFEVTLFLSLVFSLACLLLYFQLQLFILHFVLPCMSYFICYLAFHHVFFQPCSFSFLLPPVLLFVLFLYVIFTAMFTASISALILILPFNLFFTFPFLPCCRYAFILLPNLCNLDHCDYQSTSKRRIAMLKGDWNHVVLFNCLFLRNGLQYICKISYHKTKSKTK